MLTGGLCDGYLMVNCRLIMLNSYSIMVSSACIAATCGQGFIQERLARLTANGKYARMFSHGQTFTTPSYEYILSADHLYNRFPHDFSFYDQE